MGGGGGYGGGKWYEWEFVNKSRRSVHFVCPHVYDHRDDDDQEKKTQYKVAMVKTWLSIFQNTKQEPIESFRTYQFYV